MNRVITVSIYVLLLSFITNKYILKPILEALSNDGNHALLIIGIMSAQDNFEERRNIRQTWGSLVSNYNMQYYFLIGKHVCDTPPEDRTDEYSCKEWSLQLEKDFYGRTELASGSFNCKRDHLQSKLFLGFTFITHDDVVIRKLGILGMLLSHVKYVKVSLRESATGETITSAIFTAPKHPANSSSAVVSNRVAEYLLPKGFEGQVLLELDELPQLDITCGYNWTSGHGFIRYIQLIERQHEKPQEFQEDSFVPVFMTFTIEDVHETRDHIASAPSRKEQWRQDAASLISRLNAESQEMKDILFLDVIDVYRNLPDKLLKFFQWIYLNKKFSYLLKTDDDTFINVVSIEKELRRIEENSLQSCNIWWWSSFREGWPVQTAGKWREDGYRSITYPPFPCGAGYVLSYDTVQFLSTNAHALHREFQGEDVSLGIWLAGLNPCRHREPNISCTWSCDQSVKKGTCNRAQQSPQDMLHSWEQYLKLS